MLNAITPSRVMGISIIALKATKGTLALQMVAKVQFLFLFYIYFLTIPQA